MLPSPPQDPEALALAAIARRTKRVRLLVGMPLLLAGFVLGVWGYLAVRGLLLSTIGVNAPLLTGPLVVMPFVTLGWRVAVGAGRAVVRRLAPGWAEELGRQHGVTTELLEELARTL